MLRKLIVQSRPLQQARFELLPPFLVAFDLLGLRAIKLTQNCIIMNIKCTHNLVKMITYLAMGSGLTIKLIFRRHNKKFILHEHSLTFNFTYALSSNETVSWFIPLVVLYVRKRSGSSESISCKAVSDASNVSFKTG